MDRHPSVFAALFAAFLLALLPACGMTPRPAPRAAEPLDNPHVVERVAPRDPDIPTGIQRSAGEFNPEALIYAGYIIFYVFYGIVWCCVELGHLIYHACAGPPYHYEPECD